MNPYKILQLEQGADKQAVKKAYFKLIRQYPPEKEPEKFKEIREAYEYLQEEINLVNVQKAVQLPEEFKKPYYQVLEWIREGKYDKAAALCESVLNVSDLLEFRILLGKSYIFNNNSGKAVKLWEGLCKNHDDNAEYLEQLGDAYIARGWNNKAFQVYYELYEKNVENLHFYEKLIDIAILQEKHELVCEISNRILNYYRQLKKHTREDSEIMNSILFMVSGYMAQMDYQWFLAYSDEMLEIMSEVPMEFKIYEDTLFNNYYGLIHILDQDEAAGQPIAGYAEYILANEKNISADNRYNLVFVKAHQEEIKIKKDPLIHEIIKETTNFWYALLVNKAAAENVKNEEMRMMQQMTCTYLDNSNLYDTLLYMINKLNNILSSLLRVDKEYPMLKEAMGEHLEVMLNCTSQERLFRKYERIYKKLMGYPIGARLSLTSDDDEDCASYETDTYRRESAKIGRNEPCPCGSGKKYKKCCGNNNNF